MIISQFANTPEAVASSGVYSYDWYHGPKGETGETGPTGPQGEPGQGIPSGGTEGQILAKNSSEEYDTHWIDAGGMIQQQSDWEQEDESKVDFIKHKPTIPTVNDPTITFTQGDEVKGTITLNQSGDQTIAFDAGGGTEKTKLSEFTDDLGSSPVHTHSQYTVDSTLKTVAKTGSYNDLTDKPTIPAEQVQSNWNETSTSSKAYIQNKPTIPDVYDSTITFTQGNEVKGTITLNQSTSATIALDAGGSDAPIQHIKKNDTELEITDKTVTVPVGTGTLTVIQGGVSKGTFNADDTRDVTITLDAGGGETGNYIGWFNDEHKMREYMGTVAVGDYAYLTIEVGTGQSRISKMRVTEITEEPDPESKYWLFNDAVVTHPESTSDRYKWTFTNGNPFIASEDITVNSIEVVYDSDKWCAKIGTDQGYDLYWSFGEEWQLDRHFQFFAAYDDVTYTTDVGSLDFKEWLNTNASEYDFRYIEYNEEKYVQTTEFNDDQQLAINSSITPEKVTNYDEMLAEEPYYLKNNLSVQAINVDTSDASLIINNSDSSVGIALRDNVPSLLYHDNVLDISTIATVEDIEHCLMDNADNQTITGSTSAASLLIKNADNRATVGIEVENDDAFIRYGADAGQRHLISSLAHTSEIHDSVITITQGGETKGSFSLNQAGTGTVGLDAANNGTLTIVQGSTTKGTFTADSANNVTITLDPGESGDFIGSFDDVEELEHYSGTVHVGDWAYLVTIVDGKERISKERITGVTDISSEQRLWRFNETLTESQFPDMYMLSLDNDVEAKLTFQGLKRRSSQLTIEGDDLYCITACSEDEWAGTYGSPILMSNMTWDSTYDRYVRFPDAWSNITITDIMEECEDPKAYIATIATPQSDVLISHVTESYADTTEINDSQIIIYQNGLGVGGFTLNQSTSGTVNITETQSDWNQSTTTAVDFIKNKPTIPTVNDSTVTVNQGGTSRGSFTLNQSSASTLSLYDLVPTTVTIASSAWSGTTATVSVTGVTASTDLMVTPQASSMATVIDKAIYCSGQGAGTLTFTATEAPSADVVFIAWIRGN